MLKLVYVITDVLYMVKEANRVLHLTFSHQTLASLPPGDSLLHTTMLI